MNIPGYTYANPGLSRSPVSLEEFELMKKSVLFTDEDVQYLRMSLEVVADRIDAILDVWYGFIGGNPHLVASFTGKNDDRPITDYLGAVRKRFGQWILDTARAQYDQKWLDYQHEIGLRHHRSKKNQTDGVAAKDIVPFRYLFPVVFPVTLTLKPFLAEGGHSDADIEKMHAAWLKSCLLQMTLWSHPYIKDGDF
jgi:hypothetical protein